jgi:Ca2+-binding RTX toxin-like protein
MALINGTAGHDTLADTTDSDTINGFAGNDTINGGHGGTDVVDGGDGRDSLQFMTATSAVVVDFVAGTAGTTSFTNIEKVVTGDFNDQLTGNSAAQNLTARSGSDTLWGAGGFDTLWGGSGADTFIFREFGSANADNIGDWTSGSDELVLDGAVMTALGASGDFTAGDARFWSSSTGAAHDADDRILYNTTTRQVFYDADGNGSGAAQLIATLQSGATLVATDIVVEGGSGGGPAPLVGTEGNDTLSGTTGDDTIEGLGGHDELRGLQGADLIRGGAGNDTLFAHSDSVDGFDDSAVDTLDGGLGDDEYHVSGQDGDTILADPGGIDTVFAWNSSWTLGPGLDNLVLADNAGVGSDGTGNELDNRIESTGEGGNLFGLGGNDTLVVQNVHNTVGASGGDGNDTLLGGSQEDGLFGDAGNDLLVSNGGLGGLTGGAGVDTFFFNTSAESSSAEVEGITDFASGTDTIRLDASVMSALGASGRFHAEDGRFVANSSGTAQDSFTRIIYNTSTGELLYDADGDGTGAAAFIATLQGAPALAAADIEVVNGTPGQAINGTSGDDSLVGTESHDTINGFGGNDTIDGLAGNDLLDGGSGNDSLIGDTGADTVVGGDGDDTLDGAVHARQFDGTRPELFADTLDGGLGNDLYFASELDTIVDSGGIDTLHTDREDYTLAAGLENLTFQPFERGFDGEGFSINYRGNASDNVIIIDNLGESSSSSLDGGAGRDTLDGSGGEVEFIFSVAPGEANADTILAFFSNEGVLVFDANAHAGIGASGNFAEGDARFWSSTTGTAHDADDRVIYNTSNGQLWYDADGNAAGAAQLVATLQGAPTLEAADIEVINGSAPGNVINGTSGADTLADTAGNDTINGLAGNDTINGGTGGTDVVNGGDGRDTLAFMTATSAVMVDFVAGTAGNASFTGIEKAVTGDFNDTLDGNAAAQNLTARAGSDTLAGAGGVDTLWGGAGADTFVFRETGTANADTLGDWTSGADELALDNAAMGALGADGAFVAGDERFWASSTGLAHDADDRVVYNTSTRGLYYDADGNGSGAAQLIATVQAGAAIAATDIVVI